MGIFSKEVTVFQREHFVLGEVDPTNISGTGYANVMTFPFDVEKNRVVRVQVKADIPVDVALAYEDSSMAGHKEGVTDGVVGPFPTKKYGNMGLFLGVNPGDKATVSVRVWTDRK